MSLGRQLGKDDQLVWVRSELRQKNPPPRLASLSGLTADAALVLLHQAVYRDYEKLRRYGARWIWWVNLPLISLSMYFFAAFGDYKQPIGLVLWASVFCGYGIVLKKQDALRPSRQAVVVATELARGAHGVASVPKLLDFLEMNTRFGAQTKSRHLEQALARLLARMTADEAVLLSAKQQATLRWQLRASKNEDFQIALILVLATLGGTANIRELQRLVQKQQATPRILEAARECLRSL
jgi:hypothetical protein